MTKKTKKHWIHKGEKISFDRSRPLSWSAISSFEWNKEQWWNKYVLHQKCTRNNPDKKTIAFCFITGFADPECPVVKTTPELEFGTYVDKRVQVDHAFLPTLPRYSVMQHEMNAEFNGIPLIGLTDAYEPMPTAQIRDYKTGRKKWDQKRADETGQLTMYGFLLWLTEQVRPEDVQFYIDWMPTHYQDGKIVFITEGDIRTFQTYRNMRQVLEFGQRITRTYEAMIEYAETHVNKDITSAAEFFSR